MKYVSYIILIFLLLSFDVYSQEKIVVSDFIIVDGDTFFTSVFPEVEVLDFKNLSEKKSYFILKRKVLIVYPFALLAKEKLLEIELGLDTISKRLSLIHI